MATAVTATSVEMSSLSVKVTVVSVWPGTLVAMDDVVRLIVRVVKLYVLWLCYG